VHGAWQTLQKRSKKTGKLAKKAKTKIDVKADPLLVHPDAKAAATVYGYAVKDEMIRQLNNAGTVSATTIQRRRAYANNPDSPSYRIRYMGVKGRRKSSPGGVSASGRQVSSSRRVGHMPPTVSNRWGVDSGRLTRLTVTIRQNSSGEAVATVNVPSNRLDPLLFDRDYSKFEAFRAELIQRCPAWGGDLARDPVTAAKVNKALAEVAESMVAVSDAEYKRKLRQRRRLIAQILSDATGLNIAGAGSALGVL